jgi:hypothetical protein
VEVAAEATQLLQLDLVKMAGLVEVPQLTLLERELLQLVQGQAGKALQVLLPIIAPIIQEDLEVGVVRLLRQFSRRVSLAVVLGRQMQ